MEMYALLKEIEDEINSKTILETEREKELAALQEIRVAVEEYLDRRIHEKIMAPDMRFYAPEWDNWHQALMAYAKSESEDFHVTAALKYSEADLDNLWQNSHVGCQMSEEDIKTTMIKKIGELKMLQQMKRKRQLALEPAMQKHIMEGHIARIIGLYNMLYE